MKGRKGQMGQRSERRMGGRKKGRKEQMGHRRRDEKRIKWKEVYTQTNHVTQS